MRDMVRIYCIHSEMRASLTVSHWENSPIKTLKLTNIHINDKCLLICVTFVQDLRKGLVNDALTLTITDTRAPIPTPDNPVAPRLKKIQVKKTWSVLLERLRYPLVTSVAE